MVRILLRDILGIASQEELELEMTQLAEACLEYCALQLDKPDEVTVLALGKFGGRELLYGADLDVVFIGNDVNAGEQLIQAMGAKTEEGRVFPLDARLRPEGENGVLVIPLSAYREYFDRRAQFWEAQALTKARALCGPEAQPLNAAVAEIWSRWSARGDLSERIHEMYRRIVKERAKGDEFSHFKTGRGGLIGIEFLVQYLQMKHQVQETNTLNAIGKLTGVLDSSRERDPAQPPTGSFDAPNRFCGVSQTARSPNSRPKRKNFGSWLFEWVSRARKISWRNTRHIGTGLKKSFRSIWGKSAQNNL